MAWTIRPINPLDIGEVSAFDGSATFSADANGVEDANGGFETGD